MFGKAIRLATVLSFAAVAAIGSAASAQAASSGISPGHRAAPASLSAPVASHSASPDAVGPGGCPPTYSAAIAFFVENPYEVYCYHGHGTSYIQVANVSAFMSGPSTIGQFKYDYGNGTCNMQDYFASNVNFAFPQPVHICSGWQIY